MKGGKTMKKAKKVISMVLALTLVMTMALSFTGCGSKTPADTAGETPSNAEESSEKKVMELLIPAPVGDPFIALAVRGLEKLSEEYGVELKIIETLDKSEHEDQVKAMAKMGANPIYTMWGDLSEAAVKLAPEFPDTNFILCDVYMESTEPNVSTVVVEPFESAFIAGYVAAKTTENKKVGFIAHADRPVSRRFRGGYVNGINHVDPSITVETAFVGNDQDPVKGQEVAKLMIQNNKVDLIFQAASRSGLGVIKGCEELGIHCIGSDDWQGNVSDCVFWSALKPINEAMYTEGKSVYENEFVAGFKEYGLAQGMALYDQRDIDKLPEDLKKEVLQLTEDIKSGKIDVKAGFKDEE